MVSVLSCLDCSMSSQRRRPRRYQNTTSKRRPTRTASASPGSVPGLRMYCRLGWTVHQAVSPSPVGQFQRDFGVRNRVPGGAPGAPEPAAMVGGGDAKAAAIFRTPRQEPGIDEPAAGIHAEGVHPCLGKAEPGKEGQSPARVCDVPIHDLFGQAVQPIRSATAGRSPGGSAIVRTVAIDPGAKGIFAIPASGSVNVEQIRQFRGNQDPVMRAEDNLGPAGVIRVASHPVQHRSLPIPGRVGLKSQPDPERGGWEKSRDRFARSMKNRDRSRMNYAKTAGLSRRSRTPPPDCRSPSKRDSRASKSCCSNPRLIQLPGIKRLDIC